MPPIFLVSSRPSNSCRSAFPLVFFPQSIEEAEDIRKEVASLRLLSPHPSIVELKDTFEDKDNVHIIMELCRGGDLFDRIVDGGPMREQSAARLCRALAEALLHCHTHGVVHRDIKPENILMVDKASDHDIKLVDFGVATFFEPGEGQDCKAANHWE